MFERQLVTMLWHVFELWMEETGSKNEEM